MSGRPFYRQRLFYNVLRGDSAKVRPEVAYNSRVSLVRGNIDSCCLVSRSVCLQREDWPGRAHTHEGHILAAYF